jgi:hypothetical protein
VVEITCHGGTFVTASVLSAVLAAGAEPALPGEFTKRAFINGKLSLTEAEAVGRLIDADTEERMKLSSGAVRGVVSEKIRTIREPLFDVMTALYAAIDYPEEDVGDEGEREIAAVVEKVLADFYKFTDGAILVGHNVTFDYRFVKYYGEQCGYMFDKKQYDTLTLAQEVLRGQLANYKLNTVADYYGFTFNHHRAFDDACVTAKVFIELVKAKGKLD